MDKKQVFISYSHSDADRDWIKAFAKSLKGAGFSVWLDDWNVQLGEDLSKSVENGLRNSDVIVSLVTPQSVKQPWLFFELGAAVSLGKRVIAIVSKDVDFSLLPQSLRIRKFLWQQSPEETADALISEAKDLAQGTEMEPALPTT